MLSNQDAAAIAQKCIILTAAESVRSFWLPVAEIGRSDHILFDFSAICVNNILNENTDIFRKSQGPAALYFFIQQSYMTYKCENSQNDHHGLSSVKF